MEILAVIPARGGSKGIKRKNLKSLCGKPLVTWSIEAALHSNYITRTVVSTEDSEIAQISKEYGAEVIIRPQDLALDETKTAPVMLHTALYLENQKYKPDYIVLLQPTCPLRDADYINKAFDFFFNHEKYGYDSCFSGFSMGYTHSKWKILHNGSAQSLYDHRIRPRRQDVSQHYKMICENGAFYALKYDVFKEVKDFIGKNPVVYITPRVTDIDEEKDFILCEQEILKREDNAK